MTQIKKAELWFARVVPDRPNKKFNKDNPTWEVQIRTYDAAQKKEWEAQGIKLKAVVPDDGGKPFWKTTLKKKIRKKDGSDSTPVEVKGGNLRDIDPAIIGNGSIGNIRVYQYEYKNDAGQTGIANVLMSIQLTKLIKYTPKPREDDFEEEEMEVIEEEEETSEDSVEEEENDESEEEAPKKKSPSVGKKPDKFD